VVIFIFFKEFYNMNYKRSAFSLSLISLAIALFVGCHAEVPTTAPSQKSNSNTENRVDGDFAKGLLNRAAVIKSSKSITCKKYPNADDVLVDNYNFSKYNPDGTSITWDDVFIKVLTEKGRRDNQSISFYFALPYSTVKLKLLEVIKKDGTVVPVDIAANSKVMIDSSQMGQNIYNPNSKVLTVNIPGLEIGDMVRYLTNRNAVKPRVPNTWCDDFILEYTSPIKHMTIEVLAPAALPLSKVEIKNPIKGTVKYEKKKLKDAIRYKWAIKNVPRMFKEPNMPPLNTVVQRLLLSTINNWKDVSKWYWNLAKAHIEDVTPAMRKKVAELTKGAGTSQQKIKSIFHFVSQQIRYMGLTTEKEAPGYEPHDASLTFNNKYGVCRDKATLLVTMLRIAGFKAYPVLIMNGPKKDPDVPNPYFNHAITCIEEKSGKYMLMDSTDENTRVLFPAYLCNQSYLVAKPQGETLQTSPIIPASKNMMQITTHATVNDTGLMIAETALKFSGINDGAYRGYFANRKPLERKRFFEKIIKKIFPGAKLVDYDIQPKNIRDTSQGLKVYIRYIAENTMIKGDGKVMLPSPWMSSSIGMVNLILGKTGLEKRQYPLVTDIACGVREQFTIDLKNALGSKIALPDSKPIKQPGIEWYRTFDLKNKILSGKSEFILNKVEFSPKEYAGLKSALKKIEYNKRKKPLFYSVGVAKIADDMVTSNANVATLNTTVDYKVKDNSTWEVSRTIRKKILTYAGKKSFSDLKFLYNPAWENITVEYAKVTLKNGTVKKISKDEINLMDASWVGSAPRYPPSKILVISLPGVEVGSIIEYRVVRKYKNRPFFSALEYFQGFNPIVKKTVRMETPKEMKLKVSNRNRSGNNLFTYKNGTAGDYAWKGKGADALKWEQNLPPTWSFVPSCAVSSGSWRTYAALLDRTFKAAAKQQPATKKETAKILKGITDPLKKIEAIRNFVATHIKNAGPSLGALPLSAISPADTTLADGYGNNTDRAVLLYAMLKEAGFYPDFVVAADYPRIDELHRLDNVPQSNIFDKVLVLVIYKKQNIYLNDTNQYAELGTTSSGDSTALFCSSGKVGKITIDPKKENRSDVAYSIRLSKEGKAVITIKRSFYGVNYEYWKKKYAEMPVEEKSRYFQELVAAVSQSAVPAKKLTTDFSKYPGTEEFSVSIDNFAVIEKQYLYIKLPGSLKSVLGVFPDIRENPFLFNHAKKTTRSYLLNLPEEYANKIPIAPNSNTWTLPSNAGTIAIINDRDIFGATAKPVIFINQDVDLKPAMIPTSEFDAVQRISSSISNQKTQTLMMEKAEKSAK
jgi:transglutaminase-like putative cysteine protease